MENSHTDADRMWRPDFFLPGCPGTGEGRRFQDVLDHVEKLRPNSFSSYFYYSVLEKQTTGGRENELLSFNESLPCARHCGKRFYSVIYLILTI